MKLYQHSGTLGSITCQCPTTGGEAVYKARALLGSEYDLTTVEACDRTEGREKSNISVETMGVSLFPNPTYDRAVLTLNSAETGTVIVSDRFGRNRLSFRLVDQRSVEIDTESLGPGLYFVAVTDTGGQTIATQRLIILR